MAPPLSPLALKELRVDSRVSIKPDHGPHSPARVVCSTSSASHTFEYGADMVWRYVYVSTWGNGSFISGPGCDASGQPILDLAMMTWLDGRFGD